MILFILIVNIVKYSKIISSKMCAMYGVFDLQFNAKIETNY